MIVQFRPSHLMTAPDDPELLIVQTPGGVSYAVKMVTAHLTPKEFQVLNDELWVLHVFTQDDQRLFGFQSFADRQMVVHLCTIPGMGPTLASRTVQLHRAEGLTRLLAAGDAKALARVCPGLGPKKAEAMIQGMRAYLGTAAAAPEARDVQRIQATLAALGREAKAADIQKLIQAEPDLHVGEYARRYLQAHPL